MEPEPTRSRAPFHAVPANDAGKALGTDLVRGLEPDSAAERLARDGPNELPPPRSTPWAMRLARQLAEPMAILLVVAASVAGFGLHERLDAAAILAIVALNAVIGVVEEGKAARALEALRSMETPMARVRRAGATLMVPSREIVPGDLVVVSAGDRVPADLRLVDVSWLEIDESILTGESLPVAKDPAPVSGTDLGLADLRCIAFSGTHVSRGAGEGVAVATGRRTALGAIAEKLAGREPATPLQRELRALTARLGAIAVVIAAGVFGLTALRMGMTAEGAERSFLAAVALAVAAVPEGLATVVTVALALGVRRMAARGAIVRRLPAVETLGSTTVILTDKTGTLTENRMELRAVALHGRSPVEPADLPGDAFDAVAEVAALCNDATLEPPSGDPLDLALLEAIGAGRVGDLRRSLPRRSVLPFDSERKRMTTLHETGDGALLLVKGAPETVTERCADALTEAGGTAPLASAQREEIVTLAAETAARGMRMLALARRELPGPPEDLEAEERDLTFVALVGLRDPVRPQAAGAVAEARGAGIRLVMVTGDHPGTASAVAEEVRLIEAAGDVLTGTDLRRDGLPPNPVDVGVYARVDPDQKLALVEALQERGHVVAVTGDGVNDAPALRRADIGVAMGRTGSDVAREAADMVVTDDDLATIVTAVREGRGIYDNIRKVVDYLVAGNLSEITVVVASLLLFPALGVPLLPLQLLWINLLTDGLPAIALGVDPPDPHLMQREPRRRDDRLLALRRIRLLSGRGFLIATSAIGSLAVARFVWDEPWDHARAVMFSVLMTAHLLYAFAVRGPDGRGPILRGITANPWLMVAVCLGIGLQLLVVLLPQAHGLFGTAPLSLREWMLVAGAGVAPVAGMAAIRAGARRAGT